MVKKSNAVWLLVFLVSCATSNKRVIERMDDVGEKPEWATISKTVYKEDGKVFAVGIAQGDEDASISALGRISDNNAKSELARYVKNEIGVIFQNVEEGTGGNSLSRYLGTEKSLVSTSEIVPARRYWEKTVSEHNDVEQTKIDMYSLVSIEERKLKQLVRDSISKEKSISKELKQKVDQQLDNLLEE